MIRYKQAFYMNKNLVIVESPAKAKTIAGYLGPDFTVMSSIGHIRDLPAKDMNIDIANNFEPNYEVPQDKKRVVSDLKKAVKTADKIWLASDEDREGEAIAWHLAEVLGLSKSQSKRIVFHEITKDAITEALKNPRDIDTNLVDAQQARRILDRLVGYELSPVLWRKIRPGLSAGRVQSVAVRLIVEREREIESFEPEITFKVVGDFEKDSITLNAQLKDNLKDAKEAEKFLEHCKAASFTVSSVTKKPGERNPSPPFTTSTLQQEAARRLGFSVKQTMQVAQKLYENGHITYMRTDSMNLSSHSIASASSYITKTYGANYAKTRAYKTKNSSAQEAHEAIRPTNISRLEAGQDGAQQKLYQLIWKRTVASQMSAAKIERTDITIDISSHKARFAAKGEILIFDGFYKVYGGSKEDQLLPDFKTGDKLTMQTITATEHYTKAPPRYSEASLVKTLEDLGIGRPSTYAPTISTIQTRGYIVRGDVEGGERQITTLKLNSGQIELKTATEELKADKNKLAPTHLALVTTDFLVKQFADILDYGFTARAEADLDAIAEGKAAWQEKMKYFYELFHPLVIEAGESSRQEAAQARLIGNDPKSGEPIYARYGKFGPMLQKGDATDDKKPAFAPMPEASRIDTVTLEEALTMFTLPRNVGSTVDGQPITANIGRFGPYIQIGKTYVSIKPASPFEIDEITARELYAKKLEIDAKKDIKSFSKQGINVLNGPFGAYVTDGKKNARIPKSITPKDITLEQAQELLAKAKLPKKRIARKKK
jgi:DNA topoisomerase I